MDVEVNEFYKREAKREVDFLFDKGFLSDDLSRESIDWLEDYLGFLFQSKCDIAVKAALLSKKVRDLDARNKP